MAFAFFLKDISYDEFAPLIQSQNDVAIVYKKGDKNAAGIFIVSTTDLIHENFKPHRLNQEEFDEICFKVNNTRAYDIWGNIELLGRSHPTPPATR